MIDDYSGLQKAAILLITLGPEKASAIFQHLKEDEIESLTLEIANTRSVSPQDKESVLDEYYQVCLAQQYIAEGGIGYAKELLEKALGSEKAQGVISKLTASLQVRPFEFVRKTEPAQLLNFIQDEHPQTIAMILSYLSSSQAAMILGALPPEKQADVARRIAQMDRTSPDVIKEVERVLERKLSSLVNQDYTIVGGIDSIVNILNSVDRATEKRIMESLEVDEPELAEEIRKKMFVFEDILLLDDRSIQRVLRDVENADLELALKSSTEEVQNVIFRNLSKRLAAMIKEDMDFMGPVRMKDVEEAQQKIVAVIRKLEDSKAESELEFCKKMYKNHAINSKNMNTVKSVILDISGGGIRFSLSTPLEEGTYFMAQFSLALEECTQQFNIVCKVINCTQSLDYADRYFARSKFIFDRMTEREKIVRFVFEEERRIRRREME